MKIVVANNIHTGENIGIFLNGSIDSAIIAYIAKILSDDLHTYSIGLKSCC